MLSRPSLLLAVALALAAPAHAAPDVVPDIANASLLHEASLTKRASLTRNTAFVHRTFQPERPSGRTIIMLHGSGGDETTLASLASAIAPDATLIGIRGRVVQDGIKRWYKRITPTEFDQQDVRSEAAAFVEFLQAMASERKLDLASTTFLGYSNGANLIAAMTQLHPGIVRKAVLLRAMPVLGETPPVDLSQTRVLTISGEQDKLYFPFAPALADRLRQCGARVDARTVDTGHGIGEEDARIVAEWLGAE